MRYAMHSDDLQEGGLLTPCSALIRARSGGVALGRTSAQAIGVEHWLGITRTECAELRWLIPSSPGDESVTQSGSGAWRGA